MKYRTRCPWTNTLCGGCEQLVGVLLGVGLVKPQWSLVPCASRNVLFVVCRAVGVLNNVLDGAPSGALDDVLKGALDDVLDGVLALLPSA